MKFLDISWFKWLTCRGLCSKEYRRTAKLKEKVWERFDNQLDIRTFVKMQIDLAILSMVLLNEQQYILFSHHRQRSINQGLDTNDECEEDEMFSMRLSSMSESRKIMKQRNSKKQLNQDSSDINELLGFQVNSPIDLQLLMGLFNKSSRKAQKLNQSQESYRNHLIFQEQPSAAVITRNQESVMSGQHD